MDQPTIRRVARSLIAERYSHPSSDLADVGQPDLVRPVRREDAGD
jgi:hypothetical protein